MKHAKFNFLLFNLILAGCTSMEPSTSESDSLAIPNRKISIEEAIEIAYNMGEQFSPATSRATHSISQENVKIVVGKASRSEASDTLLYIVNFNDNQGFAIVAATNIEQPEIAYIPSGNYDPNQLSEVEPFEEYMKLAMNYVEDQNNSLRSVGIVELQPVGKFGWDDTVYYADKKHALKISWGQSGSYGQYCPNRKSGCVPTAIAMLIAYRNKSDIIGSDPTTEMHYTFPNRDIDSEFIHWAEVYKHVSGAYFDAHGVDRKGVCTESNITNTHKTIARLMRQIGADLETEYIGTGYIGAVSNTMSDKIYPYVKKIFPYYRAQDIKNYYEGACEEWINRSGLCIMMGINKDNNGHCWICDGYLHSHINHYVREDIFAGSTSVNPPGLVRYVKIEEVKQFVYLRWGWDGEFDGMYNGSVFELKDDCRVTHNSYTGVKYIGTSPY